jgi:hypothetical protein
MCFPPGKLRAYRLASVQTAFAGTSCNFRTLRDRKRVNPESIARVRHLWSGCAMTCPIQTGSPLRMAQAEELGWRVWVTDREGHLRKSEGVWDVTPSGRVV